MLHFMQSYCVAIFHCTSLRLCDDVSVAWREQKRNNRRNNKIRIYDETWFSSSVSNDEQISRINVEKKSLEQRTSIFASQTVIEIEMSINKMHFIVNFTLLQRRRFVDFFSSRQHIASSFIIEMARNNLKYKTIPCATPAIDQIHNNIFNFNCASERETVFHLWHEFKLHSNNLF